MKKLSISYSKPLEIKIIDFLTEHPHSSHHFISENLNFPEFDVLVALTLLEKSGRVVLHIYTLADAPMLGCSRYYSLPD